ncbi:AbrB/MazE/SpoVT family DNA-binding domain-containing protein [Sphingomonas sp. BK069]|uniref:AbrB/MazE/SpoVT family DNA-binding domain-containing protein n=1 Tax=Sphingomonas sp. BK069 TaxID=2586979 RepID=UPI0018182A72|nr:AbrB/MazE/SpoVT family DNA-binding domain-containing protein [Sphingomonas sp. BK069]MBB3349473.1 AbrB family looped-hinge helix DNA binding protein [Sphingomonas sp. BK069]
MTSAELYGGERDTMNAHNGRLVSGGRLQLPSDIRRELGLADGDQVVMRVVDGELHIRPRRDVLKRIQAMLRPYAPVDGSVTDELITERRTEAARD